MRLTTHIERVLVDLAMSHPTVLALVAKSRDTDVATPQHVMCLLTMGFDTAENATVSVILLGITADLTVIYTANAYWIELDCLTRDHRLIVLHR